MEKKIQTKSVEETIELAKKIMTKKFPNMVICLDGELGAGKTTLTKGIAVSLGIDKIITSPTFTIIKEYPEGELPLYHIDVYRLEGNIDGIGLDEYFSKDGVVVIEWSEMIKEDLPDERLDIKITSDGDDERTLTITPHGDKYQKICEVVL